MGSHIVSSMFSSIQSHMSIGWFHTKDEDISNMVVCLHVVCMLQPRIVGMHVQLLCNLHSFVSCVPAEKSARDQEQTQCLSQTRSSNDSNPTQMDNTSCVVQVLAVYKPTLSLASTDAPLLSND
jgi:hypothetical protein